MSSRQFSDGAFDRITLLHLFFKLLGLLIAASLLQKVVMLTYHDGAMNLSGGHPLRAQWTAPTMVTPFRSDNSLSGAWLLLADCTGYFRILPDTGHCA